MPNPRSIFALGAFEVSLADAHPVGIEGFPTNDMSR